MPRFIVEVVMSQDLIKYLVDNPSDRFSELVPVYQERGITFEQRYYVVGENKLIDIISADSADAVHALALAALASGVITSTTSRQIRPPPRWCQYCNRQRSHPSHLQVHKSGAKVTESFTTS